MTSPRRFTSGPPELPGLIDASVWMKFSYVVVPTSDRPVALTTPTVTVWSSPNGLPIAIAHSPTRSLSESPSAATVSGALGSTWTVPIWTTAGRTRSATLTKADCRASAVLAGPSGPDPPAGGGAVRSAWSQKPPPRKAKRALARRTVRALLGAIWSPDGSRVRLSRNTGTDAIHLMLECQGNYCNHVFSLTLPSAKRDNETIATPVLRPWMNRHNLRRTLCVVLVASLLAPSFGFGQPQSAPSPGVPSPGRSVTTPTALGGAARVMPGPEYRLGPGDVLEVQLAGRVVVERSQVFVDPTGAISLPPLGSILVGGLTLLEAQRRVAARASGVFRFANVTLAVALPRTFEVTLSGEVERPGTFAVSALRRLHEVILDAGGVT